MDLERWAVNEINLIRKRQELSEYSESCYKSALKAFRSLLRDNHSGASIRYTIDILNRFIDGLPLTDITEDDFYQSDEMFCNDPKYLLDHGMKSEIQCPRMSSLFRTEYYDGEVRYNDVNRTYAFEVGHENIPFSSSITSAIIDKLYPITLPYCPPNNKYYLVIEYVNDDNEDCSKVIVKSIKTPDGNKIVNDRIFTFSHQEVEVIVDGKTLRYQKPSIEEITNNE